MTGTAESDPTLPAHLNSPAAVPARATARGSTGATELESTAHSRHGPIAQLLIAWSPLSAILVLYFLASWVNAPLGRGEVAETNRAGFGPHVDAPAAADRGVFTTVPSVWLQERFVDGSAHWYDAVAAVVYATHFVSIPVLTAVVWFCFRDRFVAWIAAVLTLTALGVLGYVVYPAVPPWIASQTGVVGPVVRISTLGWDYVHLGVLAELTGAGQGVSNPVAAMPSLHAATALLLALFCWPLVSWLWRAVMLTYALLMAVVLVYTGEHWVVDIAAGWLVAAAAALVGNAVYRRRPSLSRSHDTAPRE